MMAVSTASKHSLTLQSMTLNQRFTTVSIIASSFAVWLYLVTQVQPDKNDMLIMVTFFLTLIVWLGSAIAYGLYIHRVKKSNREIIFAHITPSLRQGFIIAATLATLLFLELIRVLSGWDIVLLIASAVTFELALSRSSHSSWSK
jgi:hypothetical protein